MPMKAAIYARVSTTGQGQSPEMQLRDFAEYAERRGWTVAGCEYVDVGISGAKERRPELDRLIADAHKRNFDAVVVWSFDRFARSVSHLLRALETFNALGIAFVSLSEQIDTSTPGGPHGVHRPGRCGRARALADRGEGPGGYPERTREG